MALFGHGDRPVGDRRQDRKPAQVRALRVPHGRDTDAEDARIACLLALDRFAELRPLIPHGPIAGELRALARDDERAVRDERRLLNRLRADRVRNTNGVFGLVVG